MPKLRKKRADEQITDALREAGFSFKVRRLGRREWPTMQERRYAENGRAVKWAVLNRPDVFTPAQAEALVLVYGDGMTPAQAARHLGLTRQAFDDRLRRAEQYAADAYGWWMGGQGSLGAKGSRVRRRRPKKGRAS